MYVSQSHFLSCSENVTKYVLQTNSAIQTSPFVLIKMLHSAEDGIVRPSWLSSQQHLQSMKYFVHDPEVMGSNLVGLMSGCVVYLCWTLSPNLNTSNADTIISTLEFKDTTRQLPIQPVIHLSI